jgi:predicted CoA-substrate-specific enzyme activase
VAAVKAVPGVRTIIEIGGQDSKLILVRDGLVSDFGMNTVCAAGTGSFLDHQAARLNMSIEEFSRRAEAAAEAVEISGKCTVFAESDMIHRQQNGADTGGILYGLCRALVRNYLSDVASGKDIQLPVVFQGGVAFNRGIIRAFREELGTDIIVPPHHEVMGAMGAAMIAREHDGLHPGQSSFRGFGIADANYRTSAFTCRDCPENCSITSILQDGATVASREASVTNGTEKQQERGVK